MPEIAEVRVVRDALKKNLINKKIGKIKILYSKIVENENEQFCKTLKGLKFTNIKTYGKYLIFELGNYSLISHLRMEGKYFYVPTESEIGKHTHVIFSLDDGYDLRYDDVRKFGRMKLVKTDEVYRDESLTKLGLEPDDSKLNSKYLMEKLQGKKIPMKSILLDQTIICGLGNIYANEVLFATKIHPLRNACDINQNEAQAIIDNSKKIITKSYESGGCTIRSYTSSLGVIGHYQDYLNVQSREGEACPICKNPIKRIKIDGRSTFFCEVCQK